MLAKLVFFLIIQIFCFTFNYQIFIAIVVIDKNVNITFICPAIIFTL